MDQTVTCKDCGDEFNASDSIGSNETLCQDCWEEMAYTEWWMAVQAVVHE